MPDLAPYVRGNQTFFGARQNFFSDERGNCRVKAVEHHNAFMMISRDNHAGHCGELVAANFYQHVEKFFSVGAIDFEGAADNLNFMLEFFIINVSATTGDLFGRQVEIGGSHSGGDRRISNSHFANEKTITAGVDSLFSELFAYADGLHSVFDSHRGAFSDILSAARKFSIDEAWQI